MGLQGTHAHLEGLLLKPHDSCQIALPPDTITYELRELLVHQRFLFSE